MQLADLVATQGPRSVLAVGSGPDDMAGWKAQGYSVTRLDIDPRAEPDIVGSMLELGGIGPFSAVYCSHALEHVYPHEVPVALRNFHRVLRPGGVCVILVPDLEGVAPNEEPLPNGLTGLHLFYGDARLIPEFPHMAHHCGFVESTLAAALTAAGFNARTQRMSNYNLMGIGIKA